MDNNNKSTKVELVARVRAACRMVLERVGLDSPQLERLRDELNKIIGPLQVFDSLQKLWTRVEHPPFFAHETDNQLEFIQIQIGFFRLQTKRTTFRQRVSQAIGLRDAAVDALPNVETLEDLESSELEQLVRFLENDERFQNYLQCDVGKIQEEWDGENLYNLVVEMVQRMEGLVSVTTEKLRTIAQANANLL